MTPRQRRMTLVLGILAGVGIAGALALSAFRSNVTFFFDPTAVSEGKVKAGEHFRLGGMVTKGSVKRTPGSLEVHFMVTDFKHDVPVTYSGVLPDLFREDSGVVAHGHMDGHGTFVADEVLAKHDEKYMPPEVARSLKRRHGESREEALSEAPAPGGAASEAQDQAGASSQGQSAPSTTSTQVSVEKGDASMQAPVGKGDASVQAQGDAGMQPQLTAAGEGARSVALASEQVGSGRGAAAVGNASARNGGAPADSGAANTASRGAASSADRLASTQISTGGGR